MIWGDWPDLNAWIGISMIIGSGIFLIYRENIKNREVVSSVPMRSAVTNSTNVDAEDYIRER